MLQLRRGLRRFHLTQRQHRVPERKLPPSMLVISQGSQVQRAAPQALLAAIKPAGQEVSPQAHAAFATTVQTRVTVASILGGACEASQQALVSRLERARDALIPHAQLPQCTRRFLAEDVTC